jgi:hypothetical protein
MQLKLPFRLTRGAAVVLFIVLVHVTLAALFIGMRVEAPEIGPVFATLLVDPQHVAPKSAHSRSTPSPATKPALGRTDAPAAAPTAPDQVSVRGER